MAGPAGKPQDPDKPRKPSQGIAGDLSSVSSNNTESEGRDEVRGKLIALAVLIIVSLPVWIAIFFGD